MKYITVILAVTFLTSISAFSDTSNDWQRVDEEIDQLMDSDQLNPSDALSLATNNLLLAENTFGATHRNTAIALYKVGWLARASGLSILAEDSYTRCWKLWSKEIIPNDLKIPWAVTPASC